MSLPAATTVPTEELCRSPAPKMVLLTASQSITTAAPAICFWQFTAMTAAYTWHGHLGHAFMGWKPMTHPGYNRIDRYKFHRRLADDRINTGCICPGGPDHLADMGIRE